MRLGLRVDVDTYRGTRFGVPNLRELFAGRDIRATFFFSLGPDNMGRHLWRLIRPSFLWKMLRSDAPSLYGWDILLRGTLWPGPEIGTHLADVLRAVATDGHEIGLHAWDHHAWQTKIERWDSGQIHDHVLKGFSAITEIVGRAPTCSAAPAWRCNDIALEVKQRFPFVFNSDCRGDSIFMPVLAAGAIRVRQPQIPVTLPTFDEVVGRDGTSGEAYYLRLPALLDPGRLNVLAIHAEVEGMSRLREFGRFLDAVRAGGWAIVPLGELTRDATDRPPGRIASGKIAGRQGWVSCQAPAQ